MKTGCYINRTNFSSVFCSLFLVSVIVFSGVLFAFAQDGRFNIANWNRSVRESIDRLGKESRDSKNNILFSSFYNFKDDKLVRLSALMRSYLYAEDLNNIYKTPEEQFIRRGSFRISEYRFDSIALLGVMLVSKDKSQRINSALAIVQIIDNTTVCAFMSSFGKFNKNSNLDSKQIFFEFTDHFKSLVDDYEKTNDLKSVLYNIAIIIDSIGLNSSFEEDSYLYVLSFIEAMEDILKDGEDWDKTKSVLDGIKKTKNLKIDPTLKPDIRKACGI